MKRVFNYLAKKRIPMKKDRVLTIEEIRKKRIYFFGITET